jgi:hypothetical protein
MNWIFPIFIVLSGISISLAVIIGNLPDASKIDAVMERLLEILEEREE